jgi:hypothetical protein
VAAFVVAVLGLALSTYGVIRLHLERGHRIVLARDVAAIQATFRPPRLPALTPVVRESHGPASPMPPDHEAMRLPVLPKPPTRRRRVDASCGYAGPASCCGMRVSPVWAIANAPKHHGHVHVVRRWPRPPMTAPEPSHGCAGAPWQATHTASPERRLQQAASRLVQPHARAAMVVEVAVVVIA